MPTLARRRLTTFTLLLALFSFLAATGTAAAQRPADDGWDVAVYPVLGWLPLSIEMDLNLPPLPDGGGGGGGFSGEIIDKRFDGAYFGGISASKGRFRFDATALWAAVGGDRDVLPVFTVDTDLIYYYASAGFEVVPNLYVTGGVRRLALKYVIDAEGEGIFERKPGLWDPLVGLGYHSRGERFDLHLTGEVGGFGVGAELDVALSATADWRFTEHFGLIGGYKLQHFKIEHEALRRTLTVKQTMHGPMLGIGLYF